MPEHGFVPLSPRRLHPLIDIDSGAGADPSREAPTAFEAGLGPLDVVAATDHLSANASVAIESAAAPAAIVPEVALPGDVLAAEHLDVALDAARIRSAAIGLAAAACARALRYAIDRNPRLLARFVDDALRAAGGPQHATVRLAASAPLSGGEPGDHDFITDASLSPGDVFVDCADGTLGATIEQRAQGLVRAVSS
jgi:hypothetical protein